MINKTQQVLNIIYYLKNLNMDVDQVMERINHSEINRKKVTKLINQLKD